MSYRMLCSCLASSAMSRRQMSCPPEAAPMWRARSGQATENKLVASIESWHELTVVGAQFFHNIWVIEIFRILVQKAAFRRTRLFEMGEYCGVDQGILGREVVIHLVAGG